MPVTSELKVTVVYDGSKPHGRRGRTLSGTGRDPRKRWLLLGLLNLVAAGGLYYGAWWRVDPDIIYPHLIMNTPLPGVQMEQFANLFGPPVAKRAQSRSDREAARAASLVATKEAQEAGIRLWSTAYAWLALITAACCTLALSSGALLGRAVGPSVHRASGVVAGLTAAGLLIAGGLIWSRHEMGFPPDSFRAGIGGLVVISLLVGVSIGRGVRWLTRTASIALILSAVGSAVALAVGARMDAIAPEHATPVFLIFVFVAQSAWGWVLLPIAGRIAR